MLPEILRMKIIFHTNYYYLIHMFQKFFKAFGNNSSANIKLSKTQLNKIVQPGGFLGRYLGPLTIS